MIKKIGLLILVVIMLVSMLGCSFSKQKRLIGTWVSPYADNQKLEIRTEELRFNYRRFDYVVKGNKLYLEETFPNKSLIGEMPFKLSGDTLTIDLGETFSGFFYGCSGKVKLQRQE
ncbi:MAG: hypothetical protein IJC09_01795 [Clostridia bacterium]|nr:hypothetical protein [Clostridia bacterium]